MKKRQLKKRKDKYDRLMIKMQPHIDKLSMDLATFKNPSMEEASILLTNAITIDKEALSNLGIGI